MKRSRKEYVAPSNGNGSKPPVSELGRALRKLAEKHADSGAKLLNRRQLERELAERRGLS